MGKPSTLRRDADGKRYAFGGEERLAGKTLRIGGDAEVHLGARSSEVSVRTKESVSGVTLRPVSGPHDERLG